VLLGGHHAEIAKWRRQQALQATWHKRPELIARARQKGLLGKADEAVLKKLMSQ
jgi:tRNA (guanine37-N1)-methyltransferase